ncbi:rod shape-determining protein MreD [Clostridium weizhouense]|uniref:Rod shape-determining protein MreD n=1 Tax=Clostridium weizhouense TaxID=2859781 RepID=A0ABS7AJJ5_9CLOT|nr:rod shape-determining protein MreD [Clostridium weizhouense]MBW6408831.1 rod shape-determining protein MreD [Clostridium weizhouense]
MEKLIVILVSIVLVILDNSLVPFFSINGVYPSLLFTFAIAYSIINGREKAVFIGAISGILQDLFFFYGFGVNSLLNLFLCIVASLIGENIFKTKRLIPVISTLILTILKAIGILIIFYFLKIKMDLSKSLIMGIYNAIIIFLCYKLVMNIPNEEYKKRPWRFK